MLQSPCDFLFSKFKIQPETIPIETGRLGICTVMNGPFRAGSWVRRIPKALPWADGTGPTGRKTRLSEASLRNRNQNKDDAENFSSCSCDPASLRIVERLLLHRPRPAASESQCHWPHPFATGTVHSPCVRWPEWLTSMMRPVSSRAMWKRSLPWMRCNVR